MSDAVRVVAELADPDGLDLLEMLEASARFERAAVRRIRSLSSRVRQLRRERDAYRAVLREVDPLAAVSVVAGLAEAPHV